MISIVRSFGAPVIEPPGNDARRQSTIVALAAQACAHGRDELVDGLVALDSHQRGHATEPISATRPRSLRSTSTIIRFSARSLAPRRRRAAASRSSRSGRAARGRALDRLGLEPAVAVERRGSARARSSSTSTPPRRRNAANGAGLTRRSTRCRPSASAHARAARARWSGRSRSSRRRRGAPGSARCRAGSRAAGRRERKGRCARPGAAGAGGATARSTRSRARRLIGPGGRLAAVAGPRSGR